MSPPTTGPTQKQLRYLRQLASRTGQTFATPRTRAQASHEIRRLRRQQPSSRAEVAAERRAVARDMAERRGDDARVRVDVEIAGHGSEATWTAPPWEQAGPRVVHCKREHFDIYVGRPSMWGNPFKEGRDGTREEVIARYERWLKDQPALLAELPELHGKVLGCWCAPKPCHADVLLRLANSRRAAPASGSSADSLPSAGAPHAFAGYQVDGERRLIVVQRIRGAVRVDDVPASGTGRRHVLANGLETCGELDALLRDYGEQTARLGAIPASRDGIRAALERSPIGHRPERHIGDTTDNADA
jgi:Domain of unknown function (DUF4326)